MHPLICLSSPLGIQHWRLDSIQDSSSVLPENEENVSEKDAVEIPSTLVRLVKCYKHLCMRQSLLSQYMLNHSLQFCNVEYMYMYIATAMFMTSRLHNTHSVFATLFVIKWLHLHVICNIKEVECYKTNVDCNNHAGRKMLQSDDWCNNIAHSVA